MKQWWQVAGNNADASQVVRDVVMAVLFWREKKKLCFGLAGFVSPWGHVPNHGTESLKVIIFNINFYGKKEEKKS